MIRTLRSLALPALMLAFVAIPAEAQDVDVSGKWEFSQEGPRGTRTTVFTFVQDGVWPSRWFRSRWSRPGQT